MGSQGSCFPASGRQENEERRERDRFSPFYFSFSFPVKGIRSPRHLACEQALLSTSFPGSLSYPSLSLSRSVGTGRREPWERGWLSYLGKRSEPRENARARGAEPLAASPLARSRETRFTRPNRPFAIRGM